MPRADVRAAVERIWYGGGRTARLSRAVLAPVSALFSAVSHVRNRLYDVGLLRVEPLALPAISVGNLSVGGTGKTPVAAWLAGELIARGVRPGIVLRGYGDDEPAVHAMLTPDAVVVADANRVRGAMRAAAAGAEVAVLDDAFQHRRAARDADVVLVSADRWMPRMRTLPAGPYREGLRALRRASLVVVTRKAADPERASLVERALAADAAGVPVARVHLAPGALVPVHGGAVEPVSALGARAVLAICGVGDPDAFRAQLEQAGARVTLRAFPDHHAFSLADVASLVEAAHPIHAAGGTVLCTLKDAVKLLSLWPLDAPGLSYLSQQVILEAGREAVDRVLDSVLRARSPAAAATG